MCGRGCDEPGVGQQAVKVGVVDIGTNSMRLLITDGHTQVLRAVKVTGLGKGVDGSGRLAADAIHRTLRALADFGTEMDRHRVDRRAAIATSATRDAANGGEFIVGAAEALGVEPEVIGGELEGRIAYEGAVTDVGPGDWLVSDIGGGSTEFVTAGSVHSIDIGSVRLSDRVLEDRPVTKGQLSTATELVDSLFGEVTAEGDLVGVAGTWTSLAAMDIGIGSYDSGAVHHHVLGFENLRGMIDHLSKLTVDETIRSYPALDPQRAPVILAGAVVAAGVMTVAGANSALISERDSLDGLASRTLALA